MPDTNRWSIPEQGDRPEVGLADQPGRVGDQVGGRGEHEQGLVALPLGLVGPAAGVKGLLPGADLLLGDPQLLEGDVELLEGAAQQRVGQLVVAGAQPELAGPVIYLPGNEASNLTPPQGIWQEGRHGRRPPMRAELPHQWPDTVCPVVDVPNF